MRDKLKDFVHEHREAFDTFEPRADLWQEICRDLPAAPREAKVIKISFGQRASFSADALFMRVAAAILLLFACGLTLFLMKQASPGAANTIATANQARLQKISPEIVEVEAYYTSQIQKKKSELSAYDLKLLGLNGDADIDQELARLDSSYTQLKKELYTTPNTDRVVEAMIQNLQIRMEVLNRQLEVLQKIEHKQKQPDSEPVKNNTTHA
ncbi:hypothetical protein I2I11_08570 [Pontibacter sp. 172403-2]|uniref:hypothetical protein n=1 Tax=Pontibacter rufus TaxID=2791028 RepID=UPI0018AF7465|nr:hypothetical protein [Pontibacter sp. 172403-2]MBF9253343.1 hypothetical protein [Pontibacter sp. 172403-2]